MKRYSGLVESGNYVNELHRLLVAFVYVAGLMDYHRNRFYKKNGSSPRQFRVLLVLNDQFNGTATIRQLKDFMVDFNPDMPRLFEKLIKAGLVSKKKSPHDIRGRTDLMVLTKKGVRTVKEVKARFSELLMPLKKMSNEEITYLFKILEKLETGFSEHLMKEKRMNVPVPGRSKS